LKEAREKWLLPSRFPFAASYQVVENINRRTAEQGTAEYRSEKHFYISFNNFCCSKLSFGLPTLRAGPQFRYSKYKRGGIPQGRSEIINHNN
jgi:hypothetical protein